MANEIPDLSDEAPTPVERPQSKSQARRVPAQRVVKAEFIDAVADLGPSSLPPPAAPPAAPAWTGRVYKKFRLLADLDVPRSASVATIPVGTVVSEQHYDVEELRRLGGKLEPVE